MNVFGYINANLSQIKYEIKIGLVSSTTLKYYMIYSRFDYYRKQGSTFRNAVLFVSLDYKISERWVCKIIKKMETPL